MIRRYSQCAWFLAVVLSWSSARGQKFFPDDPLEKEPAPIAVRSPNPKVASYLYEAFANTLRERGERHPPGGVIPALGINTLGEVMDGAWFTNRHGKRRMSLEELRRGPAVDKPPAPGVWRVLLVKPYGELTGLIIKDSNQRGYLVRFDPPGHLEMATGATMVTSRVFHALGYWVPENYIVNFDRSRLVASPEGADITSLGEARRLMEEDIDRFLKTVPQTRTGGYRASATLVPDGEPLGPFQFHGTRTDDPNDLFPHEHRRELRGLSVFAAWLGHNYVSPVHTFDFIRRENDVNYIRHYHVDFFLTLGGGFGEKKKAWEGFEPFFNMDLSVKNFLGLGLYFPDWQRAQYPWQPAAGNLESEVFDPKKWTANFPLAAFENRLPDDAFWAARLVMRFTDDDIRALVKAGEYSDPQVEEWIARRLIERRDKIGRAFLDEVLPLAEFNVESGELRFEDLAAKYGFAPPKTCRVEWSEFQNATQRQLALKSASGFAVPAEARNGAAGSYWAARISSGEAGKTAAVYLRKEPSGLRVVGIDRDWPGKPATLSLFQGSKYMGRYTFLLPKQREMLSLMAGENNRGGPGQTAEALFRSMGISEQITFEAVTHALANTELETPSGERLGKAVDLIERIERVAGQYVERRVDEQFRLFCRMRPDAVDLLRKSAGFYQDRPNVVWHPGYPVVFRQRGKGPSLEISLSEDGRRGDIDVDYRPSGQPEALWNGRLSAANSDVRAGGNARRHNSRWKPFDAWWTLYFGNVTRSRESRLDVLVMTLIERETPLLPDRPAGARPGEVWEAMQEFLADWLVRHRVDEAMLFAAPDFRACPAPEETGERRTLPAGESSAMLRKTMKQFIKKAGTQASLTLAMSALAPWDKRLRVIEHPFQKEFTLAAIPAELAADLLCPGSAEGQYYGAFLRFKVKEDMGGGLMLIWTHRPDGWQLAGFDALLQ